MPPTVNEGAVGIPRLERHAMLSAQVGCIALALLALAIGSLVYFSDRNASASLLMPASALNTSRHWFGAWGQWLPSFVHPFAFSLFTASLLARASPWRQQPCRLVDASLTLAAGSGPQCPLAFLHAGDLACQL